jgi:hypothetical protein
VVAAQRFIDTEAYRSYKKAGKVVYREFATPPATSGPLESALLAAKDVLGVLSGATNTTDNASVSLHAVGPAGAGGRRRRLLAVSETPKASYIIDPESLATVEKVRGRFARRWHQPPPADSNHLPPTARPGRLPRPGQGRPHHRPPHHHVGRLDAQFYPVAAVWGVPHIQAGEPAAVGGGWGNGIGFI